MLKQRILRVIFWLSCLYVVLAVLGVLLSQFLPSAGDAGLVRETMCFWDSDWFSFVTCGDKVFAHSALGFIYNFLFLYLFLYPLIILQSPSVLLVLVVTISYAPIVYLLWYLFMIIRKNWRKKQH